MTNIGAKFLPETNGKPGYTLGSERHQHDVCVLSDDLDREQKKGITGRYKQTSREGKLQYKISN